MLFIIIAVISILKFFIAGCVTCPEHCSVCNSTEHCFLCHNGYYGANCTNLCTNCASGTACTRDKGICEEACKAGLSGAYCDKPCDTRCVSCLRNETTKCLTYKYNQTSTDVCPKDCVSQICQKNLCTNGCLPGYWGLACNHTCPEPCKAGFNHMRGYDVHTVAGVNVAVPVLSVLLVTLLGVVLSMLFCRRRWMRHRDSHAVLYRPKNAQMRPMGIQTDPVEILSNNDSNNVDNYDHVLRQVDATRGESQDEVLEEELAYNYAKPLSRSKSQNNAEDNAEPLMNLGNVSGISEGRTATPGTTGSQNNAVKFLGNLDPSYFSSLRTNDDLLDQYNPLDKSACTGTDKCDYQK